MKKDKIQEEQQDIELSLETGEEQGGEKESPAEEALKETIKKIKETASEEDPRPYMAVHPHRRLYYRLCGLPLSVPTGHAGH